MGKLGGIILLATLVLTGCASGGSEQPAAKTEAASATAEASQRIAPLLSAPSPAASIAPEFNAGPAQSAYLAGVKKVWRGEIPSDEVLLKAGGAGCTLLSQGKTWAYIGGLAGKTEIEHDNGAAVAIYASRNLCTAYNTDR